MTLIATDVAVEPDERPVEEVRCSETGVPLPTIPAWYATVSVNFVSAHVKKNAYIAGMPGSEMDAPRVTLDGDTEPEAATEEVELEDIEIEDEETEEE